MPIINVGELEAALRRYPRSHLVKVMIKDGKESQLLDIVRADLGSFETGRPHSEPRQAIIVEVKHRAGSAALHHPGMSKLRRGTESGS